MTKYDDIFLKNYPHIDLHGYDRDTAVMMVDDFINENIILGNKTIVVIHGKGQGILKENIHCFLKKSRKVEEFKVDNFNPGITIVKINKKNI